MEYMRIEGVLGGAISALINKTIETKLGFRPTISIDEFNLKTDRCTGNEGVINEELVILNLSACMSREDFNRLIEEATR